MAEFGAAAAVRYGVWLYGGCQLYIVLLRVCGTVLVGVLAVVHSCLSSDSLIQYTTQIFFFFSKQIWRPTRPLLLVEVIIFFLFFF